MSAHQADTSIIDALRALHEQFRGESRSADEVDAWLRYNNADAPVIALLERDRQVAAHLATSGHLFLMTAHGGVEYKLRDCVAGFLRQLQLESLSFEDEAARFLRAVRLTGGLVPALVRTVVFGFSVAGSVELPFGTLVPAMRRDIVLPNLQSDPPLAVVLEAVCDVPAVIGGGGNHPWSSEERDRSAVAEEQAVSDPLDRLMVSLAVSYANPIQQHLMYVGPLYSGGLVGRNPLPIGAALINPPPDGYPALEIGRLQSNAEIVTRVRDIKPIAVAARRYFMGISERARPADALIDHVIAIEALTDASQLRAQRARLVQLVGGGVLSAEKINEDFTLIKHARNDIVHTGQTAARVDSLVGIARMYVDLAIQARVREELHGARRP